MASDATQNVQQLLFNSEGSLDPYDDLDMTRYEDTTYTDDITNQKVLADLANWELY